MLTRLLRRVIAYDGSWYYDPRSDRPGRLAHLKLQQNSHFQAQSSSISRDGDPYKRTRAEGSGQTHRTHHP